MKNISIERREFIKRLGAGAVLGLSHSIHRVVAKTPAGIVVDSPGDYGGFLVEKIAGKSFPYEFDPRILRRMSEKSTTFSRNVWDPDRQDRPEAKEDLSHINLVEKKGKMPNQTRLDYALMAASWHTATVHGRSSYRWDIHRGMVQALGLHKLGPWDPVELDMTWEDATLAVKHAALFYGASLAGVAELNPLWLYSDRFSPKKEDRGHAIPVLSEGDRFDQTDEALYIPQSMDRVVALAFEEDFYGIANSPGRLASAAVGNGYSRMAFTASTLAEFIRGLGYRAIPAGNGIGLSIPMAIDAGLGELGRLGLLITPKYGPRIRLAKVLTDMPLRPDPRISFGVGEFCDTCKLCADECPSGAISDGPRTWKGKSPSNNPGTLKWYIESEKCYDFNGFSCSNCKRVCPFTKPNNSWLHRGVRKAIEGRIGPLNTLMVTLDQASGYGRQLQDREFWDMDGGKSITARESM
ncbi:MAG: reductive dehalogenase [Candidatus Aminicenantes bacterium]|jgi:reductive dehalogenase